MAPVAEILNDMQEVQGSISQFLAPPVEKNQVSGAKEDLYQITE